MTQDMTLPFANAEELLEQLEHSVLIADPEGRIQYVNAAFEETTGYGRKEIPGETPAVLKSGVHSPDFYRGLWRKLKRGDSFLFDFTNRKKSGELYQESVWMGPLRDSDGTIKSFVSLRQAASRTVNFICRIADASPVGVYLLKNGEFVYTNPAYQGITGYRDGEGKHVNA